MNQTTNNQEIIDNDNVTMLRTAEMRSARAISLVLKSRILYGRIRTVHTGNRASPLRTTRVAARELPRSARPVLSPRRHAPAFGARPVLSPRRHAALLGERSAAGIPELLHLSLWWRIEQVKRLPGTLGSSPTAMHTLR